MAESYSRVSGRFWIDTKSWGERHQRVALYLLTNRNRTMEGLYYLPLGYLAEDLGITAGEAHDAVRFIETQGLASYDHDAQVVFLRKALKHGAPATARHVQGAISRLRDVRSSCHWDEFVMACECHASALAEAIRMEWGMPFESSSSSSSSTSKPSTTGERDGVQQRAAALGFDEWLADHATVTGKTAPGVGTKTRAELAGRFVACCGEVPDPPLPALKLATRAAHADEYRREHGYDGAENVLRVTKVLGLVNNGRRLQTGAQRAPTSAEIVAATQQEAAP